MTNFNKHQIIVKTSGTANKTYTDWDQENPRYQGRSFILQNPQQRIFKQIGSASASAAQIDDRTTILHEGEIDKTTMDYENAYIELPGEANPLSRDALIRNLALGANRQAGTNDLQTATKQLQEWEAQSVFYLHLQSVFVDQGLPFEVRYLAILQLLNAVSNKHAWGRAGSSGVNATDKVRIRGGLLVSSYREADDRLARQNALLTARIVRSDITREWPNVFEELNATIAGGFDHQNPVHLLQMRRALELEHIIIKELSRASLKLSILRAKAHMLLEPVAHIFRECSSRFVNLSADGSFSIDDANALGLLIPATGIIRRLLVRAYPKPHQDALACSVFESISHFWLTRVQQSHPAGSGESSSSKKALEKVILQITKCHLELAEENPIAFISLPGSAQLQSMYFELIRRHADVYGSSFTSGSGQGIQHNGDADETQQSLTEKLVLRGILLLRATLKALADPNSIIPRTDAEKQQKEQILSLLATEFFPESTVQNLLELIVSKYFVFTSGDLRRWEEEPDEWEASEGGDTEGYRYSVRLSAEKLFLDLVNKFTERIVPGIVSLVQSTMRNASVGAVQKESVYTALGLAADKIFVFSQQQAQAGAGFDFNSALQPLIQDLQNRDPSYRLIRRRIAILLGKWIHIQLSKENRPLVYQIFLHLLDKSDEMNDLVVRVTAGRQLKEVISDWEFEVQPFLPYAPDTISRLMSLIAEVELPETKMALLETISSTVEQMGSHIAPFAGRIVEALPGLWDESGEETLRKQVIVTLLVNLLGSLGRESGRYQDFALFIIKAVLVPEGSSEGGLPELERMALLADALDLWRAVLDNTPSLPPPSTEGSQPQGQAEPTLHPDLLTLLKSSLIPVLGMDSEARRAALEITSSYFLLIPSILLSEQQFLISLLSTQANDLRSLKSDASAQVFEVVETLLRGAEDLAGVQGVQSVVNAMIESRFTDELIEGIREAWEAHQTTGPKAMVSNVQGEVETDFLAVLARILYASPEIFISVLADPSLAATGVVEKTMEWLLEEWFAHAQELVTDPARQKLLTMALTHLLTTSQPFILNRLQQLMDLWVSVIESLTESNEDKSRDSLVYTPPANPIEAGEGQSAGEARKAALQSRDPVHTVNLREMVGRAVVVVVEGVGGMDVFRDRWLVNVDKEVLEGFGRLGIV